MKVVHIITGLDQGGAENVLYRLLSESQHPSLVISLTGEGVYGPKIRELGIEVISLNLKKGLPNLIALMNFVRILRKWKPSIVQTWMYHADLFGGLVAKFAVRAPILWGIHNSNLDAKCVSASTRIIAKTCALLSNTIPEKIISCSKVAAAANQSLGYSKTKVEVIPNGVDVNTFMKNENSTKIVLPSMNPEDVVIGCFARWNPQKDHRNLIQALNIVINHKGRNNIKCALFGSNIDEKNTLLKNLIQEVNLCDKVLLFGPKDNVAQILQVIDINILPSAYGEAFPLILIEAMASEIPCIATNVGDSAQIIQDTGWVVPPREPHLLADAIISAIDEFQNNRAEWKRRCHLARKRVVENYSVDRMAESYNRIWRSVSSHYNY